jgi:hypothetical protein
VKAGEHKIALYMSDRRHAGETLEEMLKQRSRGLDKPIRMSDALAGKTKRVPEKGSSSSSLLQRAAS